MTKIYFLKAKGRFIWKIGISANVSQRKKQIEAEVRHKVTRILVLPLVNAKALESRLHGIYAHKQHKYKGSGKTEWFALLVPFRGLLLALIYFLIQCLVLVGCLGLIFYLGYAFALL